MKSLLGKLLAPALLAGMLAASAPASAADMNGLPVNILCMSLQNAVNAILNLNDASLLSQAAGLVDQMVRMGCSADMIPTIPTLPV